MISVMGDAGGGGSNFVLDWPKEVGEPVINFDKLTYAGNLNNLASLETDQCHIFVQGDICDASLVSSLLAARKPHTIAHFAGENHVGRPIRGTYEFIRTKSTTPSACWRPRAPIGPICRTKTRKHSAFCMWQLMKSTAHLARTIRLLSKTQPMRRIVHVSSARQPATVWCAITTTPAGCLRSLQTVLPPQLSAKCSASLSIAQDELFD